MWPGTCLLLRSPVPHTLACSLDSSVTGSVFVSQIQQASSCFKAIAFSTPSGLKTLPLPIPTSDYFSLLMSPKAAYPIPDKFSCMALFPVPYSIFPVWNAHSFIRLLVNLCLLLLEYKHHEGRNVYGLSQYLKHSKKSLLYTRDPITIS